MSPATTYRLKGVVEETLPNIEFYTSDYVDFALEIVNCNDVVITSPSMSSQAYDIGKSLTIQIPQFSYQSASNCGTFTYTFTVSPSLSGLTLVDNQELKVYSNDESLIGKKFTVTVIGSLLY